MLKKINIKRILQITSWSSLVALFVVVLCGAIKYNDAKKCTSITIKIDTQNDNYFIDEQDVKKDLKQTQLKIKNQYIKDIEFKKIEKILDKNDFIENAELYTNVNGNVVVNVQQKNPIARLLLANGESVYMSDKWKEIPISDKFSKRVIVISGKVNGILEPKNIIDSAIQFEVKKIHAFVQKDTFWNSMVDQIYVNRYGQIELIPVLGDFNIVFGTVNSEMEKRFKKLEIFYREGLPYIDAAKYRTIDASYKNQIVAIKKITINQQ